MSPIDDYLFKSHESLISFELFVWMQFNMYSFNSLCEKDFNHFLCDKFFCCFHQILLMKY